MMQFLEPVMTALRGKGSPTFVKRVGMIGRRYGLTAAKMDRSLQQMTQILKKYDCRATLPVTAVVLARHSPIIRKYQDQGVEFLVHGYVHVDYSRVTPQDQIAHLRGAREIFSEAGITAEGFRSPYLRRDPHLSAALEALGFSHVSNQSVIWDVLDTDGFAPSACASYSRLISYLDPWRAQERTSIPRIRDHLIEIPVSLPDDEMLIDRLGGGTQGLVEKVWRRILSQTHQRGELFTIQLHPERIALCAEDLSSVLAEARALTPSVWFARLDEIAAWWRARAAATIDLAESGNGYWQLSVTGPPGTTIVARGVEVLSPAKPWHGNYEEISGTTLSFRADCKPFIGVPSASPPALINYLRQQGYIVQVSDNQHDYSVYLDRAEFGPKEEYPLLAQIEDGTKSLVRLGCWPNGARSALCVTGDIDALTVWDYGLRLFGK